MKNNLLPALRFTLVAIVFFSGIYTTLIWTIAQLAANKGRGFIVEHQNKSYYSTMGQAFYSDHYFNTRPSAVSYNAAGSCGSNKGPTNPDYLRSVQERIDTFLVHNPDIRKSAIPMDLITASGSGLDPHISPRAALIQVKRIAKARNIPEEKVVELVRQSTEKPFLGILGPETINVLHLNIKLENL